MKTQVVFRIETSKGIGPWRQLHGGSPYLKDIQQYKFCSGDLRGIRSWIASFKDEEYNRYVSGHYRISIYRVPKRYLCKQLHAEPDEYGFVQEKAVLLGRMKISEFLKRTERYAV